jgi:hypothetical protein
VERNRIAIFALFSWERKSATYALSLTRNEGNERKPLTPPERNQIKISASTCAMSKLSKGKSKGKSTGRPDTWAHSVAALWGNGGGGRAGERASGGG